MSDGSTMVSAQFLVCENSLLAQYQSQDAYDTAVNSYGGVNSVYLTPNGTLKPTTDSSTTPPTDNSGSDEGQLPDNE